MFGIGAGEFIVILIVGLIVFGPGKLPEVGRALGKALREFRKAQAALSATLNDIDEPEKKSTPVPKIEPEKISAPVPKIEPEKISAPVPKTEPEKIPANTNMTADEIIHLAKARPIVKENSNEKISNGNSDDVPADDAGARVAVAGSGTDGADKQSRTSAN